MTNVRHGDWRGKVDLTKPCPSGRGESRAASVTARAIAGRGRAIHPHAGPVVQVAFSQQHPRRRRLDQQRHHPDLVGRQIAQPHRLVLRFLRADIANRVAGLARVFVLARVARVILREGELGLFLFEHEILRGGRWRRRHHVAKADAIIEGPHDDFKGPARLLHEKRPQLIVLVAHGPAFAQFVLPSRVGLAPFHLDQPCIGSRASRRP